MTQSAFDAEFEELEGRSDDLGVLDVPLNEGVFIDKSNMRFGFRFSLSDLDGDFASVVTEVLEACERRGVVMIPYTGIRSPWEQARLWRQSRSTATVQAAITRLRNGGADFIAKVLEDVGPIPTGPRVTNALPGYSWHQWGEAVDCYWQVGGRPEWNDLTGYNVYAEEAVSRGLTSGGYWTSIQDWPHVQKRAPSPSGLYSMMAIDARMVEMFGNNAAISLADRTA